MPDLQSELSKLVAVRGEERRPHPVAPSILALYRHEGWKAVHDAATVEWVTTKIMGDQRIWSMDAFFLVYSEDRGEQFCKVLEEEIPYAKHVTK